MTPSSSCLPAPTARRRAPSSSRRRTTPRWRRTRCSRAMAPEGCRRERRVVWAAPSAVSLRVAARTRDRHEDRGGVGEGCAKSDDASPRRRIRTWGRFATWLWTCGSMCRPGSSRRNRPLSDLFSKCVARIGCVGGIIVGVWGRSVRYCNATAARRGREGTSWRSWRTWRQ
eukprot:7381224-Prymnesium_polylepis.2